MTPEAGRWFDDAAGPVVRPYAMTRGRTSHAAEERLDLIALVVTEEHVGGSAELGTVDNTLAPEHVEILGHCRDQPTSVAELAAEMDLPVGVLRVLIGDLLDGGLVHVTRPVPPAELVEEDVLREVIDRLKVL
jgi:Protein of unknown function (DUF742)